MRRYRSSMFSCWSVAVTRRHAIPLRSLGSSLGEQRGVAPVPLFAAMSFDQEDFDPVIFIDSQEQPCQETCIDSQDHDQEACHSRACRHRHRPRQSQQTSRANAIATSTGNGSIHASPHSTCNSKLHQYPRPDIDSAPYVAYPTKCSDRVFLKKFQGRPSCFQCLHDSRGPRSLRTR